MAQPIVLNAGVLLGSGLAEQVVQTARITQDQRNQGLFTTGGNRFVCGRIITVEAMQTGWMFSLCVDVYDGLPSELPKELQLHFRKSYFGWKVESLGF